MELEVASLLPPFPLFPVPTNCFGLSTIQVELLQGKDDQQVRGLRKRKTYNISANKKETSKRLTLLILILCLEKGTWQRLELHCTGGERMNVYTQCVLHMTCNALHITQCVLIEMLTTSCQRSSSHHVYYPWLAMHYTLYNMCSRHDLQCNCTVTPVGNWKVRFQINFHWEKVKVSDASSTAVSTILKHTKLVAKWTFW